MEIKDGQAVCSDFALDLNDREKEMLAGYKDRTVVLGVRPEDIIQGGNIPVKVFTNENLGQTTLVSGNLGTHKITCKFREWCSYKAGDTVNVSFKKKHFFDKETTNAI